MHLLMSLCRGQYYKMSGKAELEAFLHDPEQYVSPAAPHPLPPTDLLPTRRSQSEVKAMFPKSFEIQGFCPVTYVDGKRRYRFPLVCNLASVTLHALHVFRYECLVAGNPGFAAEYKKKLYCFASETHLDKFMRSVQKMERTYMYHATCLYMCILMLRHYIHVHVLSHHLYM